MLVLEVQEPLAVGRDAHRARHGLLDQRALAGLGVDAVLIGLRAAPRHFQPVRYIEAADPPLPVRRHLHRTHVGVAEPRQLLRGDVEHGGIREASLLREPHDLHALRVRVLPVPHVDVRRRLVATCGLRFLLLEADRHARAVLAPPGREELAHDEALRERGVLRRVVLDRSGVRRSGVRPQQHDVVLLLVRLRLVAAQHGEARPLVAPGETVVVERRAGERSRLAGREVDQVDAVAEPVCGIDGVGEQLAGIVERERARVADVPRRTVREVAEDEIRTVVRRVGRRRLVRAHREPAPALGELEARRVRDGELLTAREVQQLEPARRGGGALPALRALAARRGRRFRSRHVARPPGALGAPAPAGRPPRPAARPGGFT